MNIDALSNLLDSVATLAWPVLALYVIHRLFDPIKSLIDSARSRKFTIEVAGNKLTLEEATELQRRVVDDLQQKIAALENRDGVVAAEIEEDKAISKRVLWVDDNPKNNSFYIAALEDKGVRVDTALSTLEGFDKFKSGKYDVVISDMGRPESDRAGIDLVKKIRAIEKQIPYFIYCGRWAAMNLRSEALAAGVTAISTSGSTIVGYILADR
jgi:CheY-like chemotaxis protein